MRYITADYIFPISSPPIKNGLIVIDDDGTIIEVRESNIQHSTLNTHYFEGIICPGFVNTHCHLELSHLKGKMSEKKGMGGFIQELLSIRNSATKEEIYSAIDKAEKEMLANGIVAVGDISNDDSTFEIKSRSKIKFHTFLEVFDLSPGKSKEVFEKAKKLGSQLSGLSLPSSIVPHAPYTVTPNLFQLITEYASKKGYPLSIHNQESEAEVELFNNKTGGIASLFEKMNINLEFIPSNINNSIQYSLSHMPAKNNILLVHNTYTDKEDIKISSLASNISQLYWCFCPNANLYIENKLPNFDLFISENAKITIGTDSYASNWSLSVLDELKTISKHAPHIPLEVLLTWATKNGAELLGFNKELGTIEKGKKPGLNLIKNVDLENMQLIPKSQVEVL